MSINLLCPYCDADLSLYLKDKGTMLSVNCPFCGEKIYSSKYGWTKINPFLIIIIIIFAVTLMFFLSNPACFFNSIARILSNK